MGIRRKIVQIMSLLFLHSSWGPQVKWLCTPVLSCHSCALSWFACPIGVLVHFAGYHVFPFLVVGTLLFFGVLFGKLFCGWVCPFGLVQDVLHKIPGKKFKVPKWASSVKYLVLLFTVLLIPFFAGESTMYSFCRICPSAALQVSLPNLISGGFATVSAATIVRWGVLIIVIYFAIRSSRSFCKAICPIGAIMALLNYISFWVVRLPKEGCASCQTCDSVCPMNVRPSERAIKEIPVNRTPDCIVCHDCKHACPVLHEKAMGGTKP